MSQVFVLFGDVLRVVVCMTHLDHGHTQKQKKHKKTTSSTNDKFALTKKEWKKELHSLF